MIMRSMIGTSKSRFSTITNNPIEISDNRSSLKLSKLMIMTEMKDRRYYYSPMRTERLRKSTKELCKDSNLILKVDGLDRSRSRSRSRMMMKFSSVSSSGSSSDPIDYCLNLLRTHDHAAVLQVPFWPDRSKSAFVAIRALNVELSKISDSVVSSGKDLIIRMRFQWWRDAIKSCYNLNDDGSPSDPNIHPESSSSNYKVPINHPLVIALRRAIKSHNLSRYHFSRIIDAKEFHSLQPRFESLDSLVKFSQSTNYSILSLLYQSLGSPTTPTQDLKTIDHSLSHLSNSITISTILHLSPHYYRNLKVSVIPNELMSCSEEEMFRYSDLRIRRSLKEDGRRWFGKRFVKTQDDDQVGLGLGGLRFEKVQESFWKLGRICFDEIEATRETLIGNHNHHEITQKKKDKDSLDSKKITIDKSLVPLFLTSTPSKTYLERLRGNKFDGFDPDLQLRDWKLPFKIFYDAKFCKF